MIIVQLEQGSDAWKKEKLGKPSASNASKIITSTGKVSTQREGYLHTLVAERLTGVSADSFKSDAMQEGNDREAESRALYEMVKDVKVEEVGVVYKDENKGFLCSPDGIINRQYGLELKNVLPKTQVKYLLKGTLPVEYLVQIQFSLYVTGYQYWDFCSYSPALQLLCIRVKRDEAFIVQLARALDLFVAELNLTVDKLKNK